jgi:hypothetical protein
LNTVMERYNPPSDLESAPGYDPMVRTEDGAGD